MKLFLRYLSGKHNTFLLFASFALIFAFAFWLYRLPLAAVLYPAMLCAAVGLIYTFIDYASVKHRHEMLSGFRGIDDELPLPRDIEDADYQEIIRLLREQRREAQTHAESEMQAMVDYYTLWAHEIKTPIAAMRLRLQGQDTAEARSLLTDLSRIERYVEMVLTYLRLEGDGTDYVIREHDLDDILRPVFKRFAGEFITRRLKLDYTPMETRVLTDEKWLAFVVEQVLSNALKYTPEGTISVCLEAPQTLCVRDTGIGIAPEDLPRVFEQSYTGLAGRTDRKASGIGLYLCKRVCDNLGHGISIESSPGEGTTVRIDLHRRELPVE